MAFLALPPTNTQLLPKNVMWGLPNAKSITASLTPRVLVQLLALYFISIMFQNLIVSPRSIRPACAPTLQ